MSNQNLDYATIRRKVEQNVIRQKRINRIVFFLANLTLFLVTMAIIWGAALTQPLLYELLLRDSNSSGGASLLIIPTIMWGTAVFFHFLSMITESGAGEKALRERLLMREVGEEILRRGLIDEEMLEKPKRRAAALAADRVRLTDDGELAPEEETDSVPPAASNRSANHNGRS